MYICSSNVQNIQENLLRQIELNDQCMQMILALFPTRSLVLHWGVQWTCSTLGIIHNIKNHEHLPKPFEVKLELYRQTMFKKSFEGKCSQTCLQRLPKKTKKWYLSTGKFGLYIYDRDKSSFSFLHLWSLFKVVISRGWTVY